MQWVGYAELAAAVSNAGGLGIVRFPHIFLGFLKAKGPIEKSNSSHSAKRY